MFIGRERELAQLEQMYSGKNFQLSLVYGRRRIGKTALLTEFTRKKDCLYFTAMETSGRQNLELFQTLFKKQRLPFSLNLTLAASLEETLDKLFEYSVTRRFVFVLDNYHYLLKGEKNLPAILERLIFKYQQDSKMMLILCSSSMPTLDKDLLSGKSVLSKFISCQIHLKPFEFFECRKFFKNTSSIDLAYIYGIVGGIPEYLLMINERFSLEDNIKNLFLYSSAPLFEEPNLLLRQEVREPALYNAILSAIANGASKLSEIAAVINEETSVCAAYLKTMILLEIVQKETPSTESTAKKTIYRISDPVFRFWYRFLPDLLSEIYQRRSDLAYRQISEGLQGYMSDVFEEICRQYLISLKDSGKTPFVFDQIGRWWGIDPFNKDKLQIPLLAADGNASILFGSCKWSRDKMDLPELNALIAQSELFSCQERYYYLFSRSGFTRNCQDAASRYSNITLVSFSK